MSGGTGAGTGDSGLVNGWVSAAINSWLTGLVAGAALPAAQLAGSLLDPARLSTAGQVREMWAGSQAIANALYVLLILAGAVMLLGHESVQTRYAVKEILPRLLTGWVAANLSWWVITTAIQLAGALAGAVAGSGVAPQEVLARLVVSVDLQGPVFLIILLGVITVITFILVLTLIVVAAGLLLVTVLAPLALCLHALPQTEALAWLWWRTLSGLLAIPTLQALLLALISRVLLSPTGGVAFNAQSPGAGSGLAGSLAHGLVVIALLYFMVKIPGWVLRQATGRARGSGMIRSLVKTAVLTAGLSAIGAGPLAAVAARGGGPRAVLGSLLGARLGSVRRTPPRALSRGQSRTVAGGPATGTPHKPPSRPYAANTGANWPVDPYRRLRSDADGQLILPLGALRRATRPTARPTPTRSGSGAGLRRASPGSGLGAGRARGRQLVLPLEHGWPENRPVLGPGGQYQLALPGLSRARAAPGQHTRTAPTSASVSARGPGGARSGRQLRLPLEHGWPENRPVLGRDGQYRLPITVSRVRPRPAPPPAPPTALPPRSLSPTVAPRPPAPRVPSTRPTAPASTTSGTTSSTVASAASPVRAGPPVSGRVRRVRAVQPELPLIWPRPSGPPGGRGTS